MISNQYGLYHWRDHLRQWQDVSNAEFYKLTKREVKEYQNICIIIKPLTLLNINIHSFD